MIREVLTLPTPGRGLHNITDAVRRVVSKIPTAKLCHCFLQHTSASLLISENADPRVLTDLETWMARAVPDGDQGYTHDEEGPDDMPAHIRAALTQPALLIPVEAGQLMLGVWQGLFLYEHRHSPHMRRLVITVM